MVDYPEALAVIERGDAGFLSVVLMTVYAVFAVMYLSYRLPLVRAACQRFGAALLPAIILPLNPVLGLIAGAAAYLPRRILPHGVPLLKLSLAAGALLRLPIMFDSLWYDEAFTAQLISVEPGQLWDAVMADVHPPLYYFALGLWRMIIGDSPFLLRLPSFALSLVSIYLIYRIVRDLKLGENVAGIAALLVATLPASIYYGAEARSYALLTVMVMVGLIAVLERRSWLAGVIIATLCYTHNVGFFYAGALALGGILYNWKEQRFWIASIASLCVGATWLPSLIHQSQYVANGHWAYITPGAVFWPLLNMTVGVIGQSFDVMLVFPVVGITAVSLWALRRWVRTPGGFVWFLIVLGVPLAEASISFLWKPIYIYRHFLPATMLLMIAWAYLLSRSRLAGQVAASMMVLALISFYSYGNPLVRPAYRALIAEYCEGADAFYATSITSAFITAQNDSRPTLTWRGSLDNGRTVEPGSLSHFNLPTGDISHLAGQTVCVVQIDVPLSHQSERVYIDLLLRTIPHGMSNQYHISTWNDLYFHLLEVPG